MNFYPLSVTAVEQNTRDTLALELAPQEKQHKELFRFRPGQYLSLRETIGGKLVRRCYSICAAVHEDLLRIAVKKVEGGAFSSWVHDNVKVGHTLQAMQPQGNFTLQTKPSNGNNYLAIAAGSGITPVLSIAKSVLNDEPKSSFTLLYGNRAAHSIMFRAELADLKNQYMGRFNLIHVLSREQQDIELFNGHLDPEKCEQLFKRWVNIDEMHSVFICGPYEMTTTLADYLHRQRKLDKQQIKCELYNNPGQHSAGKKAQARKGSKEECTVHIAMDGHTKTLRMNKNTTSILDAALSQGIDLPHACKGGVCSTCKTMLVKGQVDMDANYALEDYEIKRGYILCCQSYPVSKEILIDYDR